MIIELPFPSPILNPNNSSGKHWAVTSEARKEAKRTAFFTTKQALGNMSDEEKKTIPQWSDEIIVVIRIVPPSGSRWDMDNIEAALKSAQDGIFVALGLDDKMIVDKRTVMIRIDDPEVQQRGAIFYALSPKGDCDGDHVSRNCREGSSTTCRNECQGEQGREGPCSKGVSQRGRAG